MNMQETGRDPKDAVHLIAETTGRDLTVERRARAARYVGRHRVVAGSDAATEVFEAVTR